MTTLFSVSWTLYGLELISFFAKPGNKCSCGNTVSLFLGLIYFCGFNAFQTPALLEFIGFLAPSGTKCYHGNTLLCLLNICFCVFLASQTLT